MPRTRASVGIALALMTAGAAPSRASELPPVDAAQLAGSTLSAVAYVPHAPGAVGGGALQRIMLQAYLSADGATVVRQWLPARNGYSPPAQTRWSLTDNRLCIDMPSQASDGTPARPLCAVVHVWWPRIAGIGTQPYAMLDGDLRRGNAIGGRTVR